LWFDHYISVLLAEKIKFDNCDFKFTALRRLQKHFFLGILCFFSFSQLAGQEDNVVNLLDEASGFVSSAPDKAIKLADFVLKTTPEPILAYRAKLYKAQAYAAMGRTDLAMEWAFDAACDALPLGEDLVFETQIFVYHLFQSIGIPADVTHFPGLRIAAGQHDNQSVPREYKMIVALEKARQMLISEDTLTAIHHLKTAQNYATSANADFAIYGDPNITLGRVYLNIGKLDSASYFLAQSRRKEQEETISNWQEAEQLLLDGALLAAHGSHLEATAVLEKALEIAQEIDHTKLKVEISSLISGSSRAVNDGDKIKSAIETMYQASSELEEIQSAAINTGHAGMVQLYAAYQDYVDSRRKATKLMFWALLIGLTIVTGVIFLQNKISAQRLKDIVKYLEASRKIREPENTVAKDPDGARASSFSKSTEDLLIRGLAEFERSQKYLNNDMSLAQLAAMLDTNTKYLSEFINLHRGKNFNTYINELRIEYIMQKLKSNPTYLNYKVSYLAEESGFSSHSNFTTVFKAISGISPTKFISLIQLEKENKFSEA
jgi:YesN/AraC family two-component response regulator